ncbi:helix-turn-helix transcriptional regulator [Staphylococcus saprophyticus]|nr:helix-turn-helix transcriptional regulator [Staphylococcus saprophyticus]
MCRRFENIAGARARAGKKYTQPYMAEKLNIATSSYSQKENGHREFTATEIEKLAIIFGTTTDYLLGLGEKEHA